MQGAVGMWDALWMWGAGCVRGVGCGRDVGCVIGVGCGRDVGCGKDVGNRFLMISYISILACINLFSWVAIFLTCFLILLACSNNKYPKFILFLLLILHTIGRFLQTFVHLPLEKKYMQKNLGSKININSKVNYF